MSTKSSKLFAAMAVAVLVALLPTISQAGSLSSFFGSAYSGTTGTGVYNNGGGLSGSVEYAVFTKNSYDSLFTGSSVTVNPGELAYVYQILNSGSDFVSQNAQLGINTSAVGIGSATIDGGAGEVSPSAATLNPGINAVWEFTPAANNIPSGGRSSALVVTSTNLPNSTAVQIILNGGGTAFTMAIVPGDIPVPEPTSLVLLLGGVAFLARWRR